ncbi:MAG: hypothetical protein QW808_00040 [Desulfurococcaceae archaeon]
MISDSDHSGKEAIFDANCKETTNLEVRIYENSLASMSYPIGKILPVCKKRRAAFRWKFSSGVTQCNHLEERYAEVVKMHKNVVANQAISVLLVVIDVGLIFK